MGRMASADFLNGGEEACCTYQRYIIQAPVSVVIRGSVLSKGGIYPARQKVGCDGMRMRWD